ncbi:hypothetical protein CO731_01516 [Aminobacter sp. MSH1]|uniref:winged helix domain-containing protein n=1 Tax=Aminobacter sp. MSH1 TaxID=374606 RepID=UPI000D39F134|nr:cell envelope integrity protein TolA [Aminobacter sp. MSH1]AWC22060.1 hypothetical protein CO731_01516 [Aminobacter sp. MSH1]
MKNVKLTVRIRIEPDGQTMTITGRDAWCLLRLIEAAERGCTPIEQPAPRWSAYVHKLRQFGLYVETIHEGHKGDFPGNHARYVLRSTVTVIDHERAAA